MTQSPDFGSIRPPYLEYGPESDEVLRPGQNIVDQTPFLDIPEEIGLPRDFFTGDTTRGLASLVRTAVIEEIPWRRMLNQHTLARLKNHVNPAYWQPSLDQHRIDVRAFLDSFPHANAYLESYWIRVSDIFDMDGVPRSKQSSSRYQPVVPLTFAAFQFSRRGDRYWGLQPLLPDLTTAEDLKDHLDGLGKRKVNRKFRVYRSIG